MVQFCFPISDCKFTKVCHLLVPRNQQQMKAGVQHFESGASLTHFDYNRNANWPKK